MSNREGFHRRTSDIFGDQLSPMERTIIELTARGYKLSEIAWKLKRGRSTICFHQRRTYIKLGAKNAANAVYLFLQRGA